MGDNYIIKKLRGSVAVVAEHADAIRASYGPDSPNWGMSNPAYRKYRKRECMDIMRIPLVVPTEVLRCGGDVTLEWFRKESFDLGLRRESARAMLRYIEKFEARVLARRRKAQMAADVAMMDALASLRRMASAFERVEAQFTQFAQFREFAERMEGALEED